MQEKELNSKKIMVSACLLGIKCRYDGKSKLNEKVLHYCKNKIVIPFCPEQSGGLPTPRPKSTIFGKKKVKDEFDKDVSTNFIRGSEITLKIVSLVDPDEIIVKEGSPSCGYLETNINWKRKEGSGITTTLLKEKTKIPIKSEKLL